MECCAIPLHLRGRCGILHIGVNYNRKYAEISKWGRLRPPPVADEGSKKEWPRSKFGDANSEQQISGTATGDVCDRRRWRLNIKATSKSIAVFAVTHCCQ